MKGLNDENYHGLKQISPKGGSLKRTSIFKFKGQDRCVTARVFFTVISDVNPDLIESGLIF